MTLYLILSGIIITVLALISYTKWRMGVLVIFCWFLAEDVLRRLLPGQPFEIIFVKEIFVFATYSSFVFAIASRPRMRTVFQRIPFNIPLSLFIVINILSFFYTRGSTLGMAFIGFRSYFWYVPFIFIGYYMFRSEISYERFVSALILVSIPLTLFAVFQLIFYDRIDFVLMRPFAVGDPVHSFLDKEVPFITSVFGSHGRFARFSLMLFFLALGLVYSKTNKFLVGTSMLHSAAGIFISGQRTPMYLFFIGLFLFGLFIFVERIRQKSFDIKVLRPLLIAILPILAITILLFMFVPLLGEYFLHFSSVVERFTDFVPSDITKSIDLVGLYGTGLGVGSQGNHYMAGLLGGNPMIGIESGIGKVWYEIGLPGFLAFMIVMVAVLSSMIHRLVKYQLISHKAIVSSIIVFYVSIIFEFLLLHMQVLGDGTTLIPLWLFIGVIFGIENWPNEISNDIKEIL